MRKLNAFVAIVLVVFASASCSKQAATPGVGRDIKVRGDSSLMRLANPHAWSSTTLVVNGREFKGVVGTKPYYIEVTNKNAIVFATMGPATLKTVHLYDFDVDQAISVKMGAASFGSAIGLNAPDNNHFVERLSSDELVVGSFFLGRKNLWYIDLGKKKVMRNEYFDYDLNGVVTNQGVLLPDGDAKKE